MIRLRRMLERGRAHPILGPILLIALVLLLAFVFLHLAEEGTAAELGAMCLAIATVLGLPLLERPRHSPAEPLVPTPGDRGPPSAREGRMPRLSVAAIHSRSLPLRR